MKTLTGKTVLVTGGSGDIGKAVCRAFAAEGCRVAVHYNSDKKSADELCMELTDNGMEAAAFCCDIRDEHQVDTMISSIEGKFGGIDILVNNAGVSLIKLFDEMGLDDWNNVLGVNLTGTFLVTKRCMKHLLHTKSGSIINIASMWGEIGASCETAYSATKGGIIALTKALAKELGLSGISVNCVSPGLIDTKMNGHLTDEELNAVIDEIPMNTIGSPEAVAESCVYLAKSEFITGQVIGVNGGQVM